MVSAIQSPVVSDDFLNKMTPRAREADPIIGKDPALVRAKATTEEARSLRILFYGETGVGKTPFARFSNFVMARTSTQKRPFEQLNCACLTPDHFQDQLFGHKKGAFTGAICDKAGLVEIARGGDLFLDEIGDMPLETQSHFLTFLDSMEYYRLGDDRKRTADVRILCATNRDLKKMVEQGMFRRDLYSRISQVIVSIPALRDRVGDLRELFEYFVVKFCGFAKAYDSEIIETLRKYDWKDGNVRELKDAVELLCLMSTDNDTISVVHLADRYRQSDFGSNSTLTLSSVAQSIGDSHTALNRVYDMGLEKYLEEIESQVLSHLLQRHFGSIDDLAHDLHVSRSTLYRRLKRLCPGNRALANRLGMVQ